MVKSEPPSSRLDEVSCLRAAPKLKAARGLGGMVERLTAGTGASARALDRSAG